MADPQQPRPTTAPFDPTPNPGVPSLPIYVGRSNYECAPQYVGSIPREDFENSVMGRPDQATQHHSLKRMERERQQRLQGSRADEADEGDGLDDLEELDRRLEGGVEGENIEDDAPRAPGRGNSTTPATTQPTHPVSRFLSHLEYSGDAYNAPTASSADAVARWRPYGDPDHIQQAAGRFEGEPLAPEASESAESVKRKKRATPDSEQEKSDRKGKKRAATSSGSVSPRAPARKKRAPRGLRTLKNGEVVPSDLAEKRKKKKKNQSGMVEEEEAMEEDGNHVSAEEQEDALSGKPGTPMEKLQDVILEPDKAARLERFRAEVEGVYVQEDGPDSPKE